MEDKYRTWTDFRGNTIKAQWKSVSQDGNSVWLLQDGKKKPVCLLVSSLSADDQKYISDTLRISRKLGYQWIDGVYMSTNEIREMNFIKKARSIIYEKSPKDRISFRVFQVIKYGALCTIGEKREYGYSYIGPQFFWNIGHDGMVANGETYENKRLYWAGTLTYDTVKGNSNTILRYVEDLSRAIYFVRGQLGLFIKDDSRFSVFDEPATPPNNSFTPSSTNHQSTSGVTFYGTGFFISTNGYIVTNHHVVRDKTHFSIKSSSGIFNAKRVANDTRIDLAVLKVDGHFSALPFARQNIAKLGQDIFVMGFPLHRSQGFSPKVTKGVISSLNGLRDDPIAYQIDASIQPGNSGGPVCDSHGNLLAVVVSSLDDKYVFQHHGTIPQNVNYAIKKSYLSAFLSSIPDCATLPSIESQDFDSFEDAVKFVQQCIVLITAY